MSGCIVQIIGLILGAIGIVLTFAIMLMRQWRVTTIVETNPLSAGQRVDGQWINRWEGLWQSCLTQANTEMQCFSYESMVSLTADLKSGRILIPFAFMIALIAFIMALLGILLYICCCKYRCAKNCLMLTGGIGFLLAAILVTIPVSWITANIANQVYDPKCKTQQKIEMGEALFLGWLTILFLLLAGILLCCLSPDIEREESCEYIAQECQKERKASSCEYTPPQQQCGYITHHIEKIPSRCDSIPSQQQNTCVQNQIQRNPSSCDYTPVQQNNTYVNQQSQSEASICGDIPPRQQSTYVIQSNERNPLVCEDGPPLLQNKRVGRQAQRKNSSLYMKSLYI